jgi:uncharacterized protein (TIGR00299 family) protein
MKIAYFDCFSGVAGDMVIGSLIDAGLDFEELKTEIDKLGLSGYDIDFEKVTKNNIAAIKFNVTVNEKQPHRHLKHIEEIIINSKLDDDIKEKAIAIFKRLAEAEATVHGESVEKVHFHEVGAVDAIIDICGAVIGFKKLGIDKIYSSPISIGKGQIKTDHGLMPVPAPATLELLKGFPVNQTEIESEISTPTGAAVLTTLAEFQKHENIKPISIGYGAGTKELPGLPNMLRVVLGETQMEYETDTINILETNLDRVTPENLGGLTNELLENGALDVLITPVTMKKSRPGHLLTVLCEKLLVDKLSGIIFSRGLTLGIRISTVSRLKLPRTEKKIKTSGGEVSVKIANLDNREIVFPEYDDMSAAMKKSNKSYDDIFFEIKKFLGKEI